MNRVIAVDFDGTLCKGKWPDIGEENTEVIEALKKRQADGDILILWTCRDGDLLQAAVMWCLARGLKFDAINDNCRQRVEMYGNNPRKVSADEYWDDRGVIVRHGKSMLCHGIRRTMAKARKRACLARSERGSSGGAEDDRG